MKILFLLLIILKIFNVFSTKEFINMKNLFFESLINDNDEKDETRIAFITSLKQYLKNNFNISEDDISNELDKCSNHLFNKTNNIYNYLYIFSYSGKELSDLGLESECIEKGFSYYILSFTYNISLKENKNKKVYEFLEQNKSFIGLCLFNECDNLIEYIFNNNTYYKNNIYNNFSITKIIKDNNINDNEEYKSKPYYTLNEYGYYDESLTEKEKTKYTQFYILFIIIISILGIEIILSILIFCVYNLYTDEKTLSKELNVENDNENENDEEENYSIEGIDGQIIFSHNSSQKEKEESYISNFIKILYKYFSLFTNIIILILKKTKYFNNKNMGTLTHLRIISLILITFSANFDVLTKISSKVFYDDSFYKEIYFIFLKFASFGLDIYITLDGFEIMFKLMYFYKKKYYDKGNKNITFLGIIKFYLYSIYKIISYIILFFIVNYFNRYYIYIHTGENCAGLYSYYSNYIMNKKNIFQIFNPKYSILSYFYESNKNNDKFIYDTKMSLLFINEFYIFTLFIIIFYIGNILKSKIYDYIILLYMLISYFLTYFICLYSNNDINNNINEIYTYNKITRNILLIKYPHILFNHYLIGAFTGLICFYLKDSNSDNPISNDKDCPFIFCASILEVFDFLIQKLRTISICFCLFIQIVISLTYTILVYLNNKKNNNENITLNFNIPLKIIYYYENGIFIFTFCFISILLYSYENESKDIGNYYILNLINRISFTYANTIYLMIYCYYVLFDFELKLTYQNLWIITLGIFVFFCLENIILTIAFVMPFKIIFKTLLDKYIIINKSELILKEIQYKNSTNMINNNYENDTNSSVNDDDSNSR